MVEKGNEVLFVLYNIEDKLQEILDILRISSQDAIKSNQAKVLSSPLRKRILDLCNGENSVSGIAKELQKSVQQVSYIMSILQNANLIKEVRVGKEKKYVKVR